VTRERRGGGCSIDTVSGDLAVSSRSHLTLLKDPLSADGTVSGAIAPQCPPPRKGAGGGRGAAGRWGCLYLPRKKSVWLIRRRQGRGVFHPPPRQPLPPRGRFPIDTVSGEETTTSRSHLTLPEIRSPSPGTAIGAIATHCPPPRKGAGGGRGAAGRWGCLYLPRKKSVWLICRRQGRGMFHPPPRQPLPHGGRFPIDTVSGEETTTSRSHLTLPEIRSPSPDTVSGAIAKYLPAPSRGGGRRPRERPGGGGVSTSHGKRVSG